VVYRLDDEIIVLQNAALSVGQPERADNADRLYCRERGLAIPAEESHLKTA
jgi:hypothetical protein